MKIFSLFCIVLTFGTGAGSSTILNTSKDIDYLHYKYAINHNQSQLLVTTNETSIVFFEFEIPQKRLFFCASIISNAVSLTLKTIDHVSEQNVVIYGIDNDLINSFQRALMTYRYEQLSVTTGPKHVYVSCSNASDKYHKFDYPWWISSCHSDIPRGMLLGVNETTGNAYRLYTAIFRKYIYPNVMKLQNMLINPNNQRDNHVFN